MTDSPSQTLDSLEGLKTVPFCKVFNVAGHTILFMFELSGLDVLMKASIMVPKFGIVTYQSKRTFDGYAQAGRWLETVDEVVARKTLAVLHGKIRAAVSVIDG